MTGRHLADVADLAESDLGPGDELERDWVWLHDAAVVAIRHGHLLVATRSKKAIEPSTTSARRVASMVLKKWLAPSTNDVSTVAPADASAVAYR